MTFRFSDATDSAIVRFTVDLAATLNLKNWTIGLSPTGPDGDDGQRAFAMIEAVPHRHIATISVCDDFLEIGHENILMSLVHELCHLYFIGTKTAVDDLFGTRAMSVAEYNQFNARAYHEEEMAVDLMANAWADVMADWDSVRTALRKITPRIDRVR